MTKQGAPDDPTADFLADVRSLETPWRVDRPAVEAEDAQVVLVEGRPEKWRRTKAAGRVAGKAAPYVQAAALLGWLASGSFDGGYDDSGYSDGGQDLGDGS